ncbi:hypothetical protein HPP92_007684 [Vanilla planifolia]|uniref:ENTH domain-containing protein n=1 Tax=Vanilla planifolia TaxID=51239 RepID=A0A835V8Y4_VANPL|nr:hypothetical protein HPP92_007684 [Vanilla planifolia]
MDFMKILDQTVRDIKREVNLKVLKVPEIEQKALDATSDEPWGPHGSALLELAQATKKFTECQMIMNVLWTRLSDSTANWRYIYKSLTVIEYLIANGSERAVDDIIEHSHQISSFSGFEFVEPNGKDVGINVRKKVETILALLGDKEKIQAVRDKAASTRDKYFGLSSTGISYKSNLSSSSGSNFHQSDRYGSTSGSREGESFCDSYRDSEQSSDGKDGQSNRKVKFSSEKEGRILKKGEPRDARKTVSLKPLPKPSQISSASENTQLDSNDDEFDDFDPRGSAITGSTTKNAPQMNLFGESMVGDLLDAPTLMPSEATILNADETAEDDLFSDASFVSAAPVGTSTNTQTNADLFGDQPTFPATSPSNVDLFGAIDSDLHSETKPTNSIPQNGSSFDPFAASDSIFFRMSNVDVSDDFFGAFASNTEPPSRETSKDSSIHDIGNIDQTYMTNSQPSHKKEPFQVKSGIWADSLSRGLIDLNITAPKKTNLADIGVVGELDNGPDEKEKIIPQSAYTGRAMGAGSGLGRGMGISSSSMARASGNISAFQSQYGSFN